MIALVGIHGLRPVEITHLRLVDVDLTRLIIRVPRGGNVHTVYLDTFTVELTTAWLTERHRRWPTTRDSHLFITSPPPTTP